MTRDKVYTGIYGVYGSAVKPTSFVCHTPGSTTLLDDRGRWV